MLSSRSPDSTCIVPKMYEGFSSPPPLMRNMRWALAVRTAAVKNSAVKRVFLFIILFVYRLLGNSCLYHETILLKDVVITGQS